LHQIQHEKELQAYLIVGGTHLSPEFGLTVNEIEQDGFEIGDRVEMLLSSDSPEGISKSIGLGVVGFAQAYARNRPDILLVLGDRFETLAAVVAALPYKIPVAHIHGGETTEGAIDEAIRHSITKMSHLHFVSTEIYGRRVIQMGEEPWRVTVSGAPTLDNLATFPLYSREELSERCGINLASPTLLVTYHPVTLAYERTEAQTVELLAALEEAKLNVIFTYPNSDTSGRKIIEMIQDFSAENPRAQIATSLGTQGYFSVMSHVDAMVGNSSSGIIEAASFKLPVVNIGDRQKGRLRERNVIDVGDSRTEIISGIEKAVSAAFRAKLAGLTNPYGGGHAAETIVEGLKGARLDNQLLMKRFNDG
jgi:UDP-hydrolysing UDP-N-acetyl-D-glucosamine 2-epimerase